MLKDKLFFVLIPQSIFGLNWTTRLIIILIKRINYS